MGTRVLTVIALTAVWLGLCASALGEFVPVAGFEQQLFPSYLIATAQLRADEAPADPHRLGDPRGLLGVEIVSPGKDMPVTVTIECDEYLQTSVYSGALPEQGETYQVMPKIRYRYERLAQCEQAAPVNVTFRVQVGNGVEEEQTVTCTVRSINDCPFAFKNGDEVIDASFAFAAYVNEQHPYVDKLLREALDRDVVDKFQGYQTGDSNDVLRQAYAIWDLLVARDIRYSSITTTAVDAESVACQHVRLLEDSISNSQANCVDGSVLWVSLLRKIGIDGFLVVTPNHCYAGFYLTRAHEGVLAIETTLLGAEVDSEELEIPESLEAAIPEDMRYDDTFSSFVAALETGTKAFLASQALLVAGGEASPAEGEAPPAPEEALQVTVIDIAAMRKLGVLPIAFQNTKEFVGYDFTSSDEPEMANESAEGNQAESADETAPEAPE